MAKKRKSWQEKLADIKACQKLKKLLQKWLADGEQKLVTP